MEVVSIAVVCGVMGAAAMPLAAVAAGTLVPAATSYFGTVVAGVGTIHAADGVTATLQYATATFTTARAIGAAAGTVAEIMSFFGGTASGTFSGVVTTCQSTAWSSTGTNATVSEVFIKAVAVARCWAGW